MPYVITAGPNKPYAVATLDEVDAALANGPAIVRRVSWPEMGERAGRPYRFAEYEQTIDAFNKAQR